MSKIIIANAVKRKPNYIYYIDGAGNLCSALMQNDSSEKTRRDSEEKVLDLDNLILGRKGTKWKKKDKFYDIKSKIINLDAIRTMKAKKKVLKLCDELLKIKPKDKFALKIKISDLSILAYDREKHKKPKEAIKYYDLALKIKPKDKSILKDKAWALVDIGNKFRDSKNFKQAIKYYDLALKIDPKNNSILEDKCWAIRDLGDDYHYQKEDFEQAIKYYDLALKVYPKDKSALEWKHSALIDLGNKFKDDKNVKKAVTYYDLALKIKPKDEDVLGLKNSLLNSVDDTRSDDPSGRHIEEMKAKKLKMILGLYLDEYFRCSYRLQKALREKVSVDSFILPSSWKAQNIKKGLEYEKKVFSKFKWQKETISLKDLMKQEKLIKHPTLVLKGSEIISEEAPHLTYALKDLLLIGKPDMISPDGQGGYIPIEIKSHKDIIKTDRLRLAYYSLMLNSITKKQTSKAGIILKSELGKLNDKPQIIDLHEDYEELYRVLFELRDLLENAKEFEPERKRECEYCTLKDKCKDHMLEKGSLTLLHNVGEGSLQRLKKRGINSIKDLLEIDEEDIENIGLKKLKLHAKSLIDGNIYQKSKFEPIKEPTLFLDIETDLDQENIWIIGVEEENGFKQFVANSKKDQKKILIEFLDYLRGKGEEYTIVTFSGVNFDTLALKDSLKRYKLDYEFFERFKVVDLCTKIKNTFVFPIQSYKLKEVAKFLGFRFRHEDIDGMSAGFAYNDYVLGEKRVPKKYLQYNEDDCKSTKYVYNTLLKMNDKKVKKVFEENPELGLNEEIISYIREIYEQKGSLRVRKDKRYANTIDYGLRIRLSEEETIKKIAKILESNGFSLSLSKQKDKKGVTLNIYGKTNVTRFIETFKPTVKNDLNNIKGL